MEKYTKNIFALAVLTFLILPGNTGASSVGVSVAKWKMSNTSSGDVMLAIGVDMFGPFDLQHAQTLADYDFEYVESGLTPPDWIVSIEDDSISSVTISNATSLIGNNSIHIYDGGPGSTISYISFENVTDFLKVDFSVKIVNISGMLSFRLKDDTSDQAFLGFGGDSWIKYSADGILRDVAPYNANKWHTVTLDMDVQRNFFDIYIDGKLKIANMSFRYPGVQTNRLYISTQNAGAVDAYIDKVVVRKFKLHDNFESNVVGRNPAKWTVEDGDSNSDISVSNITAYSGNNSVRFYRIEGSMVQSMQRKLGHNEESIFEFNVRAEQNDKESLVVIFGNEESEIIQFKWAGDGKIKYNNGTKWKKITSYTPLEWTEVTIQVHERKGAYASEAYTYDIYVNGVIIVNDAPFIANESIDLVRITTDTTQNSTWFVDNFEQYFPDKNNRYWDYKDWGGRATDSYSWWQQELVPFLKQHPSSKLSIGLVSGKHIKPKRKYYTVPFRSEDGQKWIEKVLKPFYQNNDQLDEWVTHSWSHMPMPGNQKRAIEEYLRAQYESSYALGHNVTVVNTFPFHWYKYHTVSTLRNASIYGAGLGIGYTPDGPLPTKTFWTKKVGERVPIYDSNLTIGNMEYWFSGLDYIIIVPYTANLNQPYSEIKNRLDNLMKIAPDLDAPTFYIMSHLRSTGIGRPTRDENRDDSIEMNIRNGKLPALFNDIEANYSSRLWITTISEAMQYFNIRKNANVTATKLPDGNVNFTVNTGNVLNWNRSINITLVFDNPDLSDVTSYDYTHNGITTNITNPSHWFVNATERKTYIYDVEVGSDINGIIYYSRPMRGHGENSSFLSLGVYAMIAVIAGYVVYRIYRGNKIK